MALWKNLLIHLYYYGSLPYRGWRLQRAAIAGRVPVIVLFYHRVADDHANSWTTPYSAFLAHLRWLQEHCDLVSLAEAQRRIRSGENRRLSVSITFDDGYQENCRRLIPLLIREKIPCTYFVTVRHMLDGHPFPHDLADGNQFAPNTVDEIREMAAGGIEIGAHSVTHMDLGATHDPRRLRYEVVGAKRQLEALLGRPVRYYSFPYGLPANLNPVAVEMAREAGYEAICSGYGGYNLPGEDAFHLRRIHGDNQLIRLKNWITVDPRKIHALRPVPPVAKPETNRPPLTFPNDICGLPIELPLEIHHS